ncbi:MAG: hypothetical protein EOM87_05705 [Clostridia bacterium]|nr:hypothetical protein [Clostridia bacterium]
MDKIRVFLENSGAEAHFLTIQGDTCIIMFLPYHPNIARPHQIFIDNYYPAFQKIHRIRLELKKYLIDNNYLLLDNDMYYKELALMTGSVKRLKNTLVTHQLFGSFFVIEVLKIKGDHCANLPQMEQNYPACEQCSLCADACPTGSIGEEFCRASCIRELQDSGYIEDEVLAEKCGNYIWGCNICQLVCPSNRKIAMVDAIESGLLNVDTLFESALLGRPGLAQYEKVLGGNYTRPVKLLALAINAMTNAGDRKYYAKISELTAHTEQKIREASIRYLKKINKQ